MKKRTAKKSSCNNSAEIVIQQQVCFIAYKLPREIRNELNRAVKQGILGHCKKDGAVPEVFYDMKWAHLIDSVKERYLDQKSQEKLRNNYASTTI